MTPATALTTLRSIIENLQDASGEYIFGSPDSGQSNVYLTTEPIETRPVRGPIDAAIRFDGWRPHSEHADRCVFARFDVELSTQIEPANMGEAQIVGGHGIAGLIDVASRVHTATYLLTSERGGVSAWIRCVACSEVRNVSRRKATCTLSYEAQVPLHEVDA